MSAKRPRAFTNGLDLGRGGQHHHNKRPRPTPDLAEPSSDNEHSGTQTDDEADEAQNDARDNEQMLWATQQVQRDFQTSANKHNIAADSGIIEEIQCINFMCHEHLTVTLGPLINFIIGHNGSGKSAVLTALTICLGGKATATNRAQNLKSLIKEGKDHSSVQVRIKNQGALAYRPDQYGSSITVERHFNRSGTSGFKLRDHNGRIVSTKKAELEDILDAFSMQIDNPMNVLTQDMARQFLNHSTPKDKYKFFLQGTQLEVLSKDYQQIEQTLELMHTRTEVSKADLASLRKKMEELAAKARRAEHLERMRDKEKILVHQGLWAEVKCAEGELAEADKEVENVSAVIARRQAVVEEASEAYERSDAAQKAAIQRIAEVTEELGPAKAEVAELKEVFTDVRDKLKGIMLDERKAAQEVTAKEKAVRDYRAEIDELRRRQEEADDGVYAEKTRQVEEAKVQLEAAQQAFSSHGTGFLSLQEQVRAAQREKQVADQKVQKVRDDEHSTQKVIQNLQHGQRGWMEGYAQPQNLQKLLRAIETERTFRERPVGPMGRHVKLLRPEWGFILEKQFGANLNAFVVTSRADQRVLSGLMKRCNWQAPVFIGKADPIDTRAHEPDSSLVTWMRALKIDNDLVRNQFIINQSFEQVVLIEKHREGLQFMGDRGPMTRNVKMCFTFAEGDGRRGRTINYTGSGGLNDSPIDEFRGALRMQADKEDQIKQEQARLASIRQELRDVEQSAAAVQGRLNESKAVELDHVREGKRLKIAYQKAQDALGQFEEELSKATPDAAAIEILEASLADAEKALKQVGGVYMDTVVRRDQLNAENKENKKKLDKAQAVVEDLEFKLSKAQATVRMYQGQREEDLKKKNLAIAQVEAAEENKKGWVEERISRQVHVESLTRKAEAQCPQRVAIPEGKSREQLGNELENLRKTREVAEKELGGSQEQLLREANEAKRVHQEARREFEMLEGLKMHLNNTVINRRQRWQQFRSGISVRARVTFNYLLSERKFRGTLSIDHKNGLLDIHVQPDITERSADGRQTKTLSGGEKSYSTVCLLLALWDAMGSPIRCLDEFDVFMDSVNRERSMKMIIQAARRSVGRQFIFITPQAMNNVDHTSDVKIIRMSDPERNQTALRFGQA
ncbi:Structural maintenance of chromosomes protein 6 [Pleosporales sp. CAS-2024a]